MFSNKTKQNYSFTCSARGTGPTTTMKRIAKTRFSHLLSVDRLIKGWRYQERWRWSISRQWRCTLESSKNLEIHLKEKTTAARYWNRASIAAKAKLRGRANDIAFEFLPLIRTQALSNEICPPASVHDKTKAKLLITNELVRIKD